MDEKELQAQQLANIQRSQQQQNMPSNEEQAAKEQYQREMKNTLLSQVLSQQARARLNTIALAKPQKAKMVENLVIQLAQSGQIQSQLNEDQFKSLLARFSDQEQKTTTVKFDRRRTALDDDDDF